MATQQYDENGNPIQKPEIAASKSQPVQSSIGAMPNSNKPQKGSGRFTNLQAYVNANQGAGQQLGNKIQKTADNQVQAFNSQINPLNQGISSAVTSGNSKLDAGDAANSQITGFTNDLKTSSDDAFKSQATRGNTAFGKAVSGLSSTLGGQTGNDVSDIVQGKVFDENDLNNKQQDLGLYQNRYSDFANQFSQNSANEKGRLNLLANSVSANKLAAPKYSQGLAKLDQLFLQSDPTALKNIENYGQQIKTHADESGLTANHNIENLNKALTRDSQLQTGLKTAGQTAHDKLYDALNNQDLIAGINKDRDFNRGAYTAVANKIVNPAFDTGAYHDKNINDIKDVAGNSLLDKTGLNVGQRLYNAFDNKNSQDYLNLNQQNAASADDIASQTESDAYQKLAGVFGLSGNRLKSAGQIQGTDVGGFAAGPSDGQTKFNQDVDKRSSDLVNNFDNRSNKDASKYLLDLIRHGGGDNLGATFESARPQVESYIKAQKKAANPNSVSMSGADFQNALNRLGDQGYFNVLGQNQSTNNNANVVGGAMDGTGRYLSDADRYKMLQTYLNAGPGNSGGFNLK